MSARRGFGAALLFAAAGCNLAPRYARPSSPSGTSYRELVPATFKGAQGWKVAQPKDDAIRGKWWEMYGDPLLNQLEEEVDAANQTLAKAVATYRAAQTVVAQARAALWPTVALSPSVSRQRSGTSTFSSASGTSVRSSGLSTIFLLPLDASWEADLWGRLRNTVTSAAHEAQATAADLENTRLSLHAQVGIFYFQLRSQDAQVKLYEDTVVAFQKDLDLVKIRHEGGIASDLDVAQAETQLKAAIAAGTDLGINRAIFEHAIAALVGKPASTFSIAAAPLQTNPPAIPVGIPSELLERRPDIAAAERRVAEANANIGVARAAFFPTLTLSGQIGFVSTALSSLLSVPSFIWSLGTTLSETLVDGGKRKAQLEDTWALYDEFVATYRSTVIAAFQEVEDFLAELRILSQERREQDDAVRAAQNALKVAEDRYKFGVDSYLNVITAQTTLLSNQRIAATIRMSQMTASVSLIRALGGGWDASRLWSQPEAPPEDRISRASGGPDGDSSHLNRNISQDELSVETKGR
jgi:NodT family efflux transporter outer membrane factor (OMF) lipoprotein